MNTVVMNTLFLILSCIAFSVNSNKYRKFETDEQVKDLCSRDLINEVFDHPRKSSSCSAKTKAQLPDLLTKKSGSKDDPINHIDFLSYALYPKGMDNYISTQRDFSEEYKRSTNLIGGKSVQFRLGTRDHGKTLLIFFPGTANIADVKVDITVKHHSVQLPGILDEKFLLKNPADPTSDKLSRKQIEKRKILDFRVHEGVHERLMDAEIQVAIQQMLLYLYSGTEKMKSIAWNHWCKRNEIDGALKRKLEEYKFNKQKRTVISATQTAVKWYTNPDAMHIQSDEWMDFVADDDVSKDDIVKVTFAIQETKERTLENARVGMKATKVENLIISGHSLGAGYATYFFLRLYGDGYSRKAPGFHLLPDDPAQVTVIPFAAPNVVYFEDVNRIKPEILSRILNVWNYGDPVPIILNGIQHETKENVELGFRAIANFNTDTELMKLGTNQPIGNILILMSGKKRIRLSAAEDAKRKRKSQKSFFGFNYGKHLHKYKNYKRSNVKETWFKIIPYVDVKPYAKNSVFYAKKGSKCLWKTTSGGVLGAVSGGLKKHPMGKYKKAILQSCLKDYLNHHSSYWKSFVERIFLPEKRKKEEKKLGNRFKKLFSRKRRILVADHESEEDELFEKWYMDMDKDNYYGEKWYMIVGIVFCFVCVFAVGSVFGVVVAGMTKKYFV